MGLPIVAVITGVVFMLLALILFEPVAAILVFAAACVAVWLGARAVSRAVGDPDEALRIERQPIDK